ncbi:uroporphyrinogen-III C-methyltransferase [Staphylococcus sp. KY49P]|uniref:uroporphyrinogen-III C-methyltransferase n=1 Tax=Staphylococcus xylosus TaxID=1288 RepID=UPI0003495659|nr:uroporphyrinogen-III C-methyltransferase [Staphylococcus xylosus]MRF37529.1 uroporphyrinogen-III C-methyltransferase [Staphylococcus sp. KY49P]
MHLVESGKVHLVGAGPGDPTLLTRKAEQLIRSADIIFYDRLVNPFILQLAKPEIEIIDVGKRPYQKHIQQTEINEQIVLAAQRYSCVVRLKGGDPAIFGRVQEEAVALSEQGIPFEIVPGITSASAAAAKMGIGLTARNVAKAITFTTASHCKGQVEALDLHSLMHGGTLAIYMGIKRLAQIVKQIYQETKIDFPIAIFYNVSTYNEQMISGQLTTIIKQVEEQDLGMTPGIIIIGKVMDMTNEMSRNIDNTKRKNYLIAGKRSLAIEKAFELYAVGHYCLIKIDSQQPYHKSQFKLYAQQEKDLQFDEHIFMDNYQA